MCMMINVTFTCVSSKKIIFNLMTFDKNVHLTPCVNVKPFRNLLHVNIFIHGASFQFTLTFQFLVRLQASFRFRFCDCKFLTLQLNYFQHNVPELRGSIPRRKIQTKNGRLASQECFAKTQLGPNLWHQGQPSSLKLVFFQNWNL